MSDGPLERAYQAPVVEQQATDLDEAVRKARNPVHTAIFGVLFLVGIVGLPLFIGGFAGWLAAPVVGGALFGLYRITLPRGPKVATIDETAGAQPCPSCGSMQTDRLPAEGPQGEQMMCFACDRRW